MKTRLGGLVEMVLQLAQRKSAQEERSPHLLPETVAKKTSAAKKRGTAATKRRSPTAAKKPARKGRGTSD
jgi:hypothetical protein